VQKLTSTGAMLLTIVKIKVSKEASTVRTYSFRIRITIDLIRLASTNEKCVDLHKYVYICGQTLQYESDRRYMDGMHVDPSQDGKMP